MNKQWKDVESELPPKGQYVNVLEDDNINGQDVYFGRLLRKETYKPQRVRPARLRSVDNDGFAYWELLDMNGYAICQPKNVTYWQELPDVPVELIKAEDVWP